MIEQFLDKLFMKKAKKETEGLFSMQVRVYEAGVEEVKKKLEQDPNNSYLKGELYRRQVDLETVKGILKASQEGDMGLTL